MTFLSLSNRSGPTWGTLSTTTTESIPSASWGFSLRMSPRSSEEKKEKGERIMEGNHNLSHLSVWGSCASLNSNRNETRDYQMNFYWRLCRLWRVAEWNANRKHGERKERVHAVKVGWTWTKYVAGVYEPLLTVPGSRVKCSFQTYIYSSPHRQYCWYTMKRAIAWIF